MHLRALMRKSPDADILRDMIGIVTHSLILLELSAQLRGNDAATGRDESRASCRTGSASRSTGPQRGIARGHDRSKDEAR